MDTVFTQFITLPIILFCLAVSVLVYLQRVILELIWPKIISHTIWRDLILPLGPPITGGLLGGLVKNYPFPTELSSTVGRIFIGIACGLASGTVYRIFKKFLNDQLNPNPNPNPNEVDPLANGK